MDRMAPEQASNLGVTAQVTAYDTPLASPSQRTWVLPRPRFLPQRQRKRLPPPDDVGLERARSAILRDRRYRRLLVVADVLAATTAVTVCVAVLGTRDQVTLTVLFGGLPLVILASKLLGLYDRDELVISKSTLDEVPRLFQLATLLPLVLWVLEAPLQLGDLGGDQVLALWMSLFLGLVVARVGARGLARRTTMPERCLLLGDAAACERARQKIEGSPAIHACVAVQVTSERIGEREAPLSLLTELAADNEIHRVLIAPRSTDHGDVLDLVRAVKSLGLSVSVMPRLLEIVGSSVVVDDVAGLRILGVRRFGLTRSSRAVKRTFDIVGSLLGLFVLSPLLIVIAVAVRLDSPGPVLFRQQRIGRDGQPFEMLKFRTMVDGAEELKAELADRNEVSGLFKIEADPRVTRGGRLLRRTSLDELPQLWNVLHGDMSLVGPRPLIGEDDSLIEGWDRRRLDLTPGMTGPWQVAGSARIPLSEMVKLDYLYVATWSLWGDVKILLRTVPFVLRRRGL